MSTTTINGGAGGHRPARCRLIGRGEIGVACGTSIVITALLAGESDVGLLGFVVIFLSLFREQ